MIRILPGVKPENINRQLATLFAAHVTGKGEARTVHRLTFLHLVDGNIDGAFQPAYTRSDKLACIRIFTRRPHIQQYEVGMLRDQVAGLFKVNGFVIGVVIEPRLLCAGGKADQVG